MYNYLKMIKTNKRNIHKSKKSKKRINQVEFIGGGMFNFDDNLQINKDINRLSINFYYNEINNIKYFVILDKYLHKQIIIDNIQEDYIYILNDKKRNQIFVLDNDGNYINDVDILEGIMKKLQDINHLVLVKQRKELMKNKIRVTNFGIDEKEECLNFNVNDIYSVLDNLDRKIKNKCPELSLKLDYRYKLTGEISSFYRNLQGLLLCLYYKGDCISSISLTYDGEETMYIDSYTKTQMEGKKYNKLLRCIVIIICSTLFCNGKKIINITSIAANPISAWLLISNFVTEVNNIDYQRLLNEKNTNVLSKEDIFDLYQSHRDLEIIIKIPLDKININKAYQLIDNLLKNESISSIICP